MKISKMLKYNKLSIIIVNFKSKRYLKNCIASVYLKVVPKIEAEIIVINNDMGENLTEIEKGFSKIKIVNNISNVGLGAAWNQASGYARGQIICFLNPDAEVISDNVEAVLSEFEKNDNLGVLGAGLISADNKRQAWSAGGEISLWDIVLNNLGIVRSRIIWESKRGREVAWVSGTALFTRKDFFDKIGGFDENIFLYFEDADFCQRMRDYGKKILYYPEFQVKHLCGGSYFDKNKQKADFYKSQEYYFKKHLGRFQLAGLRILRKIFVGK